MKTAQVGDAALLDVKYLRLIETLYATQSVTRTAEQLDQTQSTISIMLASLRKQLNDPLFVRTSHGMQPTPRIDGLINTVRTVLEQLRSIANTGNTFNPGESKRIFRIYMPDASHVTLLPRISSHVQAIAPMVRLEAATLDSTLEEALQSGDGDLALGSQLDLDAGFYEQTLFKEDWICLVNARHPRLDKTFNLKQYQSEKHIGLVTRSGTKIIEPEMKRQRIDRNVMLQLPGFLGLSAILSTSDMVATLPRSIGETMARTAGLKVLPCPVKLPINAVKQYWHSRYHSDAGNRWLRALVAGLFLESPPKRKLI
jgi:DNA-binding transcriptional LysR family regulator